MHSINGRLNRLSMLIILIALTSAAAYLLIKFIPIAIVSAAAVFLIIRAYKAIKAGMAKFVSKVENRAEQVILEKDYYDLSNKNIIDVEYREINNKTM